MSNKFLFLAQFQNVVKFHEFSGTIPECGKIPQNFRVKFHGFCSQIKEIDQMAKGYQFSGKLKFQTAKIKIRRFLALISSILFSIQTKTEN